VIRDDRPAGMEHSDDSLQWEPFVALDVQEGRECTGELRVGIGLGERSGNRYRPWGDMGSGPARSKPTHQ
jgi:hypothetical protein